MALRSKAFTFLSSFRIALCCALLLIGVLSAGVIQVSRDGLDEFDVSGRAVASNLDQVAPMARPESQKPVKLDKPASAPSTKQRHFPPLKAKKTCERAGTELAAVDIEPGTRLCTFSETRQSPEAMDAPAFEVADGFTATPDPSQTGAEGTGSVVSEDGDDGPNDEADDSGTPGSEKPTEPFAGGASETPAEEPAEEPTAPSEEMSDLPKLRTQPTTRPGSQNGGLEVVPAGYHPRTLVQETSTTYRSPNWTQLFPSSHPTDRSHASMVFDPIRSKMVLFGGTNSSTVSGETWLWSGNWVKATPTTSPSARSAAAMAWDPTLGKVVLFGGQNAAGTRLNDAWAWDGNTWSQLTPTGTPPAARTRPAMAYDPARGGLVLFGGKSATDTYFNDTWQLKNNAWTLVQGQGISGAPAARASMGLAYSTSTSQLVLFGGYSGGDCPNCTAYNDTWTLGATASSWSQKTPTITPPTARISVSMTYDPGIGAIVMFGGVSPSGNDLVFHQDTYAWNGTNWLKAAGIASPGSRASSAMASDRAGHTVLFGGHATGFLDETWTYDSKLPLIDITVTDKDGNTPATFWVGESIEVTVSLANAGSSDITSEDSTSITSALTDTVLAAGTEITWNNDPVSACTGGPGPCGGVSDLTTTISNFDLPVGSTRVGDFVATLAGTQRGCELVRIPAAVSSVFGGSSEVYKEITVCGGGLGLEKWWTYDTTDLGNGGTASVNAANGNLVVKQYDTPQVQTRGRLALGLGRAYNSQDLMSAGGPLGAGWQFDIGDTGETSGGITDVELPNLRTLTQPLSMPYVDRDGTRHIFRLRSIYAGTALGDLTLPIDLSDGSSTADKVRNLLGAGLPFTADAPLTNLCIDQAYTGPKGSNMFLFRFIGVGSANACGSPAGNDGVDLGWSLVRPDRLRYDFNEPGDLIRVTDPTGQQLVYKSQVTYGPTEIYPKACDTNGACPKITIDYTAPGAPSGTRHVKVTDTAKRVTSYLVTTDPVMPELTQVWLPGNPLSDAAGATPSIRYTYSTSSTPCPGSAAGALTVGQLCSVTDAHGEKTTFSYAQAPLGPDRILQVTDRRGNDSDADGTSKGLATVYGWHNKSDGSPDYVTADMGTPTQVGGCGSSCERVRYSGIDAYGRVGVIEEGTSDDSYLRQAAYFWDGGAIASCSQPSTAVNHNLCQTIRRAVPSSSPLTPGGVGTASVNGVTVHDQGIEYLYGDLGQPLRKKVLLDASQAWTNSNSAITTYGTHDQYFDANGDQRAYNSHVEGNGTVVSTGSGVNYSTAVKRDGPVGYWRLGESSGTTMNAAVGPNGTYGGNVTLGYAGIMPSDTAITDSTSGYGAAVGSLSGFANGTAATDSDFTIETWQKTTNTGQQYALVWGPGGGSNGVVGRASGGKPMISLTSNGAGQAHVVATSSISDDAWHQVVYTYDGSKSTDGMKIWVDGASVPLTVVADNLTGSFSATPTQAMMFYASGDSHSDEMSLYSKVLSPARIKAHRDAAFGGKRIEADTLYAVTDQVQELSPRGNAATQWGDYLTTFRRDVPVDGTTASTYQAASSPICGSGAVGNTGLLCEVDTPASAGVATGTCKTPAEAPPAGSPAIPTTGGHPSTCTKYEYNTAGQRTTMRTPNANATGSTASYTYTYYDDTNSCTGSSQNNCDLSGTVSAGGWLKAVTDPAGEKTVYAYDAGGNLARTWDRNAAHDKDLAATWTTAGSPPSAAFTDKVNSTPVTSDALSVSSTAIVAVTPDGTVTGAGSNASGELSDGTTSTRSTIVAAKALTDVVKVSQTATGATIPCKLTAYLTAAGEVWLSAASGTTTKVDGLADIIDVHAGGCHLLALEADGDLWSWGVNSYGQVGTGNTNYVAAPTKVLDKVSAMTAGFNHTLAVRTDGTLWAWGGNSAGQLGLGSTTDKSSPTKVDDLTGVRGLGAGINSSFAIGRDGKVWAWGSNAQGALGVGDTTNRTSPTRITTLGAGTAAGPVRQIIGADNGAAALMADGKVRAWGANGSQQLGQVGSASNNPVVVPNVSGAVALAGGYATYAAADKAGTITVWGATNGYQRADGSNPASSAPVTAGFNISPYRLPGWKVRGTRDATGNLTTTTYDRLDNARRIRSGRGNDVLSAAYDRMAGYDAAGRPVRSTGAQHRSATAIATTAYDAFGNPIKTIDARGIASLATYDAVNRQLTAQVTRGDGTESPASCSGTATTAAWTAGQDGQKVCVSSVTWDGIDRKVTTTDADSQVTRYLGDAAGRQTGVDTPRNADGYTWVKSRWIYDRDGHATTFCPPRQVDSAEPDSTTSCVVDGVYSTDYEIDTSGRTVIEERRRSATVLTTGFAFDADGNNTAVTDPNNHTTSRTFDLQGRRLTQTVPRSATKSYTTRWTYDPSGNVTAVASPGSINTGSGTDGDLVLDGLLGINSTDGAAHGSGNPFKVPDGAQYRNVTLQNGAYLTANDANGLMFTASGTITVCSGCFITMAGKGRVGGTPGQDASNPNPGSGGLRGTGTLIGSAAGGGGGAHKADGSPGISSNANAAPGAGGLKSGLADFTDVGSSYLKGSGGGGGGGGAGLVGSGGAGGAGGGYIRITANKIIVNGSITAAGGNGGNGGPNSGGGGGGAGGGIWLAASQNIDLANTNVLNVGGGTGGTGANGHAGGAGSSGLIRIDAEAVTNEPVGVDHSATAMVTAISYDAANRPLDTVEGAQTLQADPMLDSSAEAAPDTNGFVNTRTRAIYNADGAVTATLPPTAFSNAASLNAPDIDVARRVDYDLDGRISAAYTPRYNGTTTSIGSGNDGGTGSNQQTGQCTAGRLTDLARGLADYGASTGVCVTRSTYDPVGNVERQYLPTSNGADNKYLEYAYTGDGLPKKITGPDPNEPGARVTVSTNKYDGTGQAISVTDALNNVTASAYTGDDLARQTTAQSYTVDSVTVSNVITTAHDANGYVASVSQPTGNGTTGTTTNVWSSDNLLSQITAPGSATGTTAVTKYTYDKVGNPIEVRDPETSLNGTNPVVNEFTYDNMILATHAPVTASSHRSVRYTYSPAGLKVSTETAKCSSGTTSNCVPGNAAWNSAGSMRLTYGANGRLADQLGRDRSAISTAYTQDGLPKKVTDPTSSVTVTAGYYLDGSVRSVDDGSNANTYAYDAAGQVTVRTDQTPAGGVTGGSKVTTSYAYNQAALPSAMDSEVLDQTTSYAYDDAGRVTTAVTGSHANTWSWNPDNSLAGLRNEANGASVGDHVYRYYDGGNIKSQTVSGSGGGYTNAYAYAPGDQLTGWTRTPSGGSATSTAYAYDRNSNRISAGVTGQPATTWSYNRDNSIATMDPAGAEGSRTFVYDNAGRLTSDGCNTSSYDDFDRVSKVELTAATVASNSNCGTARTTTYSYDGLDRQRSSVVTVPSAESGTTASVFDGLSSTVVGQKDAVAGDNSRPEVLYQLDAAGTAVGYEQTGAAAHKAFVDTDGQGNVTNVINSASGAIACAVAYEPFGGAVDAATGSTSNEMCKAGGANASSTGNSLWYRGQARDGSTGNYQLGARTYNPANGAFTAPDAYRVASPSTDLSVGTDPLTMNTYSYVNGNPINMWDPSGHDPCSSGLDGNCAVSTPSWAQAPAPHREVAPKRKALPRGGPSPYLVHRSRDARGKLRLALVQNQRYVDLHGWEESKPVIIGTVCRRNATSQANYGEINSWGTKCASTGPEGVSEALLKIERSDAVPDDVKNGLQRAVGYAAFHESGFATAADRTLNARQRKALARAARTFETAGAVAGVLDMLASVVKAVTTPGLSDTEKAYNAAGTLGSAWAGAKYGKYLACGPGVEACAGAAAGKFVVGFIAGAVFDGTLAAEPSSPPKYRPPIEQCIPSVHLDSNQPWDETKSFAYCRR